MLTISTPLAEQQGLVELWLLNLAQPNVSE